MVRTDVRRGQDRRGSVTMTLPEFTAMMTQLEGDKQRRLSLRLSQVHEKGQGIAAALTKAQMFDLVSTDIAARNMAEAGSDEDEPNGEPNKRRRHSDVPDVADQRSRRKSSVTTVRTNIQSELRVADDGREPSSKGQRRHSDTVLQEPEQCRSAPAL